MAAVIPIANPLTSTFVEKILSKSALSNDKNSSAGSPALNETLESTLWADSSRIFNWASTQPTATTAQMDANPLNTPLITASTLPQM